MKKMWETHGPQETFEIGKQLGLEAKPGEVYCLDGDLGVGKTVFTQGFAQRSWHYGAGQQPDLYHCPAV